MSRFLLSTDAEQDLDDILTYLDQLPAKPAEEIGMLIHAMLHSIGKYPYLGAPHSALTRLIGEEVRSRLAHPYRIFTALARLFPKSSQFSTERATSIPS